MQNERLIIQVEVTAKFQRNLRILAKRYRNIRKDIQPIIEQLQAGELPGDRIPGIGYTIFREYLKSQNCHPEWNVMERRI